MKICHLAKPGPEYWSFRCLECGQPCEDHVGLLYVIWRWLMGHRSAA
jgi:hypothetical protein